MDTATLTLPAMLRCGPDVVAIVIVVGLLLGCWRRMPGEQAEHQVQLLSDPAPDGFGDHLDDG